MSTSGPSSARRIGLGDLVQALPGMARQAPQTLVGAAQLLPLRATTHESIGHFFATRAARHPDRVFLTFDGVQLSYGKANAQVNRYASVLAEYGVEPGSVVGILAENRPETLLVALAAVKLGAAAGMLNHNQRGDVLAHSMRVLDSKILI